MFLLKTIFFDPQAVLAEAKLKRPIPLFRYFSVFTVLILGLGLTWRIMRYALAFPIWGDEAMLSVNFARYSYTELLVRLDHCQIAPILFLWGELTAFRCLGGSELSLRLIPFLAGFLSLILFARISRQLLEPQAAMWAICFLAVAIWPVSMSTFIKPYSLDLCCSLAILLAGLHWGKNVNSLKHALPLLMLTPILLNASFPVAFVVGAVGLSMIRPVWNASGTAKLIMVIFGILIIVGFGIATFIGNKQLHSSVNGVTTEQGMALYWGDSFPPAKPWEFCKWFFLSITGQMMAYPVGASNGGSVLTTVLVITGMVSWYRQKKAQLILLLAPFALGFVAALLQKYPFNTSCRLLQYLAPAICLFAGQGLASSIDHFHHTELRRFWVITLTWLLFVSVGIVGMAIDVMKPYRSPECLWIRNEMKEIQKSIPADEPLIIHGHPDQIEILYSWHLTLHAKQLSWNDDCSGVNNHERIWWFEHNPESDANQRRFEQRLAQTGHWQIEKEILMNCPPVHGKPLPFMNGRFVAYRKAVSQS